MPFETHKFVVEWTTNFSIIIVIESFKEGKLWSFCPKLISSDISTSCFRIFSLLWKAQILQYPERLPDAFGRVIFLLQCFAMHCIAMLDTAKSWTCEMTSNHWLLLRVKVLRGWVFEGLRGCSEYFDIQIYLKFYWQIYSFAQIFLHFFNQIYSDIHSRYFSPLEYIWIFIWIVRFRRIHSNDCIEQNKLVMQQC